MKKLRFDYEMKIEYSEFAKLCHFSMKCIPKNTARQKVIQVNVELEPSVHYNRCTDSFDNIKIYGTIGFPHNALKCHVWGEVEIMQVLYEDYVDENTLGMFRFPYRKNRAGDEIRYFYKNLTKDKEDFEEWTDYEKAIWIMRRLYDNFSYESGCTSVDTTAEEAWNIGKGVCQDYAHIYISLLHLAKIPARYVTGMMIGEGKSHAWVEFCWRNCWIGVDPTNNLLVDDNYIKIVDGRDAGDCEINRGIMFGGGQQKQEISVSTKEE